VSGDGCSNECIVESGWNCSGGSHTTRDACHYTIKPRYNAIISNSSHTIDIYFSQYVWLNYSAN